MKILVFSGGLGNQIFGYAFYLFLKEKYPSTKIFGIFNSLWLQEHNGLEIDKVFNVNLPKSNFKAKLIISLLYLAKKGHLFKNLISMDTRTFEEKAIVYSACKTHIDFTPKVQNWITFKDIKLSTRNNAVCLEILNSESVFLHVRRGDYYHEKYIKRLGGTCPVDYYNEAIKLIEQKVNNPQYYIFSDDIKWVKDNIQVPNPNYIDWNTGDNSYLDMFLMSKCKYSIIANSTFSYWGAMLGNKKKIVTYPEKWVNPPFTAPDIFPAEWIKI